MKKAIGWLPVAGLVFLAGVLILRDRPAFDKQLTLLCVRDVA
jgi:hypothetical protein